MPMVHSIERLVQGSKEECLFTMSELPKVPLQINATKERIFV